MSVAREIKRLKPQSKLIYIGQKGDELADIVLDDGTIDLIVKIRAGKWRRYHGESFWQHLSDIKTVLLNLRDLIYMVIGVFQAHRVLFKHKPDSLFVKGGYVGLPVGISAKIRGVPFMTHDSDVIPGLTNRIIGRWAELHAVGMPSQQYGYPKSKTVYTGIPISSQFSFVDESTKSDYKKLVGLPQKSKVIFTVGGGLGATRLNQAILEIAPRLLKEYQGLYLVNIVGRANIDQLNVAYQSALGPGQLSRVKNIDFTNELYLYSGCADIVVMRAGATNMAEMAMQGKACILVPNPLLTGGHQIKNANTWQTAQAAKIFNETEPSAKLLEVVEHLLNHPKSISLLESKIQQFAKSNSAELIAKKLIDIAGR